MKTNLQNNGAKQDALRGDDTGRDAFYSVRLSEEDQGRSETRPSRADGWRAGFGNMGWLCALCVGAITTSMRAEVDGHQHGHPHRAAPQLAATPAATNAPLSAAKFEMPPLPRGVTELKFSEFFVAPAGPRGLELTAQLRQLDGKRVRMLGYMVQQEEPPPGRFLFSPLPAQQVHEHDNGLADDLPASTVFVSVPTMPKDTVPHTPGLMLLTGTLSVGNRAEPDGRISVVRLALDPPEASGK